MNFLSSVFTRQWRGKKVIFGLLIALLVLNIFPLFGMIFLESDAGLVQEVSAETSEAKNTPTNFQELVRFSGNEDLKAKISNWASTIIAIFTPIIAMVVKFIGSLMGDAYIFGNQNAIINVGNGQIKEAFPILNLLYMLWDVVRTLVNYSFLLILLFFAVMNIIPYGTEEYELKKVLPRLVLAIIVVNMTFFGMRVVFDVVDVTARVVFALPQSLAMSDNNGDGIKPIDKECIVNTIPPELWRNKDDLKVAEKIKELRNSTKPYNHGLCIAAHTVINPEGLFGADPHIDSMLSKQSEKDKIPELEGVDIVAVVDYGAITIYWSTFGWESFDEGTIAPLFAFSILQIQNLPRLAYNNFVTLTQGVQSGTNTKASIKNVGGWTSLFINTIMSLILMVIVLIVFVLMLINLFFRVIFLWINIIASPLMALKIAMPELLSGAEGTVSEYIGLAAFLRFAFAPVIMGIPLVIGFIIISVGQQYQLLGLNGGMTLEGSIIDGISSLHSLFYYVLTIVVLWVGGVKAVEGTTAGIIKETFISPISSGIGNMMSMLAKAPLHMRFIPTGHDFDGKPGGDPVSFMNIFRDYPRSMNASLNSLDSDFRNSVNTTEDPSISHTDNFFTSGSGKTYKHVRKTFTEGLGKLKESDYTRGPDENDNALFSRMFKGKEYLMDVAKAGTMENLAQMIWEAKNPDKDARTGDSPNEIERITKLLGNSKKDSSAEPSTEKSPEDTSTPQTNSPPLVTKSTLIADARKDGVTDLNFTSDEEKISKISDIKVKSALEKLKIESEKEGGIKITANDFDDGLN